MRRSLVITLGIIFLLLTGCSEQIGGNEVVWTQLDWNHELENEMREQGTITRGVYARSLGFDSNVIWHPISLTYFWDYNGRDLVFVHSEVEANSIGHPLDVIVAWPSPYSHGVVARINYYADEIDFERFELTYPLTVVDLVENWEYVNNLLGFLGSGSTLEMYRRIMLYAEENYGAELNSNQWLRIRLFPNSLDTINLFLENSNIKNVDLTGINENQETRFISDDLPTWPITEEDVRNSSQIVDLIISSLLTPEEQRAINPEDLLRAEWWMSNGRLDMLNGYIENRDITTVDTSRLNRPAFTGELPTWPITEEDVRRSPRVINAISYDLLTASEFRRIHEAEED